jgi:FMN phosphatase YigB (HAD superfamily)
MNLIKENGNWADLNILIKQRTIKHYSFDFWNTIAFSNPQFKKERAIYLSEFFHLVNKEEEINSAFSLIGEEYNFHMESQLGVISPENLYLKLVKKLKCNKEFDIKKIVEDIELLFLNYPPIIYTGFLNFLELIDSGNKTISITSNTAFISGSVIEKFLESIGLLNKFKFCLFSDRENYGKPHKSIFEKVYLKKKEFEPGINLNEIIHIGDNLNTDYNGAKNIGFQVFHLSPNNSYTYPRYALNSINDISKVPFSPQDYSRFKFGDYLVTETFAKELFDFFKTQLLDDVLKGTQSIIIYSSPYAHIPTSSYYLTSKFYKLFANYLNSIKGSLIKVKLGKINRTQSYTEDYGAMNAMQRFNLIKNDTYSFFDEPEINSLCVFIDDISITGTHQRVIENMMKNCNYTNKSIFLYFAKLDNPQIEASFENDLNFAFVNSIEKLIEVIVSDSFKITTRTTKFILSLKDVDFNLLIKSVLKYELISYFYTNALLNNYETIGIYQNNLSTLHSILNNLTHNHTLSKNYL